MLRFALCCIAVVVAGWTNQVDAREHRSAAAIAQFKRQSPCPSTGARRGPCKGYVIDHVQPLCAGGADAPSNMQWQAKRDAREKDKLERAQCRALRRR